MRSALTRARLEEILRKASSKTAVVIGDIMIDHYLSGSMEISAEPPGVKLRIEQEDHRLGGAANAARNISTLGVKTKLIGIVGNTYREELSELLAQSSVTAALIFDSKRPTTTKRRYLASKAIVLRADSESREDIHGRLENKFYKLVEQHVPSADVIVISDYQKGVVNTATFRAVLCAAKEVPVLVDPKIRPASFYEGSRVLKLNEREAAALLGRKELSEAEIENVGVELLERTRASVVLLTRGLKGMILFQAACECPPIVIEAESKEVSDVVGAGDTVAAAFAVALCGGASYIEAALIANIAAGVVVRKAGTAAVSVAELQQALLA